MSRNQRPPTAAPSIHGHRVSPATLAELVVGGVGFFQRHDYTGAGVARLQLNIASSVSPSAHQNPVLPKIVFNA